jgi:glycosyltransferase involved in cell wall biosynthesis
VKVLFLSSGNKRDNLSPIIRNQGEALIKKGIFVKYFTIDGKGLCSYIRHIFILKKELRSDHYDVIHPHYGLSAIVALAASGKEKIIVSYMGDDILGTNRRDGKLTLSSKFFIRINFFLSRWFYDHSIVKSQQMFERLKEVRNVSLCPNGVNLDDFYPVEKSLALQKTDLPESKINIVFISNPERHEKNYSLSLEAIQCLSDSSVNLVPVFNVPNSVLKFYYSAADLVILTSFHEGSPNTIKEAMACNCPVVSTDVGDVRELFGDTDGHFITSFDPGNVADKIRQAIDFSKSFKRTDGRKRIIELKLDSDLVAGRILGIYEKIIKSNG